MKTCIGLLFFCGVFLETSAAIKYIDKYSPRDTKHSTRPSTRYIILHTTEAGNRSSLNSVYRKGACNYLVQTDGTVYRIISRSKIANHAGRSMWNGRTNLSEISVGIEIVGYHDNPPTFAQIKALKQLISELQAIYKLSDKAVLTHSMIAYGTPNEWFSENHRGRKRCCMLAGTLELRKKLGLDNVFSEDPDVRAGRLKTGDPYLASILYCGKQPSVDEVKPIKGITEPKQEDEEQFEGFRVVDGKGVFSIAGSDYNKKSTLYFFSNGWIRSGAELSDSVLHHLPKDTKVLVGYAYGGKIDKDRTAYKIVKKSWNLPSTFYRLPDQTIKSGVEIDSTGLQPGTIVLFRK